MSPVKLKPIQTIHFAISLSVFLFAGVVYYLINYNGWAGPYPEYTETIRTALPMIVVVCMSGGFLLRKKKLAEARAPHKLEDKIELFQKAHIIEMAFYEFTGLAACVSSLLSGLTDFLLVGVAFVGILLFKFPHKNYVSKVLGLREKDKARLV